MQQIVQFGSASWWLRKMRIAYVLRGDYIDRRNTNPKPFIWTKTVQTILDKEALAKAKHDAIKSEHQASIRV